MKLCVGCSSLVVMMLGSASASSSSSLWFLESSTLEVPPSFIPYPKRSRKFVSAAQRELEFGDYAEYPGSCPFKTSCPAICVANETDCPTSCSVGLQLCETGICLEDCDAVTEVVENPCTCEALPLACAKVVDTWDGCFAEFQQFYDDNTECLEAEEESIPLVNFKTNPWCVACYVWITAVSVLVTTWCVGNRAIFPVKDSSVEITTSNGQVWTMTGYKSHPIGWLINVLVMTTLWGFQFLLFFLTICYYIQQEAITRWKLVFWDEVQVLKAFQIVWMIGFVWSFAFRYPATIRDLFLRQCQLSSAKFVAVMAPTKTFSVSTHDTQGVGQRVMAAFWFPVDFVLRVIFWYPYNRAGYETVFCPVETDELTGKRGFYHRMCRYVFDHETSTFVQGITSVGDTLGDFLDQVDGLSTEEALNRLGYAGPNIIPIKKPTVLRSIYDEFSKPFYLYQNYMVWSWAPYWYYYMAIVNTFVRATGGTVVGVFQYMSDSVLYKLSNNEGFSMVLRDGKAVTIANTDIVPGDVVVLKPGVVSCDMVVLKSDRLVVDESALTGEANPISKTAVDPSMATMSYDAFRHKSHTLSAGTEIMETGDVEGQDLGLVLTTGSFTSKGKLVTEVLSYQRHKFKFDDEVKIVLCLLILEAIFLCSMVFYFIDEDQWVYAWFYGIFVLGTVIPPLLPTVFVVSVGVSAKRLQNIRITCTNQQGILVAGKVDAAFFDKTGTLTKQGMDFIAVDAESKEMEQMSTLGMAVCHTLTTLAGKDGSSETLIGNHVDQVAFSFTGSSLRIESGSVRIEYKADSYKVLKRFEFDSHRQTQSVIVDAGGKKLAFVKGSPESIRARCTSGVPSSFDATLLQSSKSGIYLLAMAFKEYHGDEGNDLRRDDVEKSLTFAGFLSFQNKLRDESQEVIAELIEGNVSVTMVTGDSSLTGISIAKAAGIIKDGVNVYFGQLVDKEIQWSNFETDENVAKPPFDELHEDKSGSTGEAWTDEKGFAVVNEGTDRIALALTGEAWTNMLENDLKYASAIAKHVRVFGRCNPTDKVSVISHFVEAGLVTLMAGDGQNDCGSLKSAHVGVALSTNEASVVAPFTSLDKTITSVVHVLREGRCALASAFAVYSYYIIYGQIESYLQTINAYLAITFTEWCWVMLDGIWSILLAFSLPLSKPAHRLSTKRPTASLLGPRTMVSVCGLLAWNFIFLVIALAILFHEDWFQCRKWNSDDVSDVKSIGDNYEASVLFLIGGWQYIISAIALSFGYTWRESFWKNYIFVALALTFSIMQLLVVLYPSEFSCIWRINCENENAVQWVTTNYPVAIANAWNTTLLPIGFRWKMVGVMIGNLIALVLWQYVFVNGFIAAMLAQREEGTDAPDSAVTKSGGNQGAKIPMNTPTNGDE
ncbi:hypothetical protein ACA910_012929 [Epithemia clementina (nom. ined.)]